MSKKPGQDPEKTRAKILEVAFMEIYRKGFQGVGVREIATKAELTIGAFFHHFPTKNHIAHAIIDEIIKTGIMDRWIRPLAAYKNPVQGILKCFKNTFDTWPDEYVQTGCPLNNLTQEMANIDDTISLHAREIILMWVAETEQHLKRAKSESYLKKEANTKEMAEFIVTLQEGTFAMGKTLRDRKVFDSNYLALKAYLNAMST